jgi:signal transduction histidine kinase
MYRYWAIGWVIYTAAAFWGVLLSSSVLVITDVFSITGLYVGATIISDGSLGKRLDKNRIPVYIGGGLFFCTLLALGLIFSWPFYIVFIPLGVHISYACYVSIKTVNEIPEQMGQPKYWLLGGFLTWIGSWLSFPLIILVPEYYTAFMVIQAVGVVVAGASMLTLFMRTVTRDLERQYKVTQIMSSLVQHDIRNYIQVAKLSLELTENQGIVNNHWVEVASESLDNARAFVDEMREIASTLTRFKPTPEPTNLYNLIDSIKQRVITEYSLESDQIEVNISTDTQVFACRLSRELLWNIFDNSFKHGSDTLQIQEINSSNTYISLQINDQAGGLTEEIKQFLNSSSTLSEPNVPGLGLGIILIQSLSQMCGTQVQVTDFLEDSKIVGTTYVLKFKRAHTT